MADDVVRNVIFRTRVEAEASPTAKDTADTIREITKAEQEGAEQAKAYGDATKQATATAGQAAATYDATAAKMRGMFQVIKDGAKNVLAYTALDGQLRKVDATFRSNAQGAVVLEQRLEDIGAGARRTGGDLEELKKRAAAVIIPGATPSVTPNTVSPSTALSDNAVITELALKGVSEEARAMALELLKAGETGETAFNEMNGAALKEIATLQELVRTVKETAAPGSPLLSGELTSAQEEAIDLLVTMGALQEEHRATVVEATKILNAQEQLTKEAEASARAYAEQRGILEQLGSRVDLLKQKRGAITGPDELATVNDELREAQAAYTALANSTAQAFDTKPVEEAIGVLDQYSSRIDLLKQRRVAVTDPEELAQVNDLLAQAKASYDAIANASAEATAATNAGLAEQISVLDQYASRVKLLEQKRISVTDPDQLAKVNDELRDARAAYDAVATSSAKANDPGKVQAVTNSYRSLRTQLQEAKAKLDQLVEASGGKITPQIIEAAQAAGLLQDRFEDINATVNAFNPDKKFQVLTGLIQNSLGAFTALQGAMALVGVESEGVEKSLLKVQSALAVSQGLQALFNGLRDNLRNLRLQLIAAVTNARALYAAEVQAAGGAAAQGAATSGLTGALVRARAAAIAFGQSLLANPYLAAAAGIALLVAGYFALRSEVEETEQTVDDFFDTLEERSARAEQNRQFREARALIQAQIDLLKTQGTEEDKLAKAKQDNAVKELSAIEAIEIADQKVNDLLKERNDLQERVLNQRIAEARAGAGFSREEDPTGQASEIGRRVAEQRVRQAFNFQKEASEEQLADEKRINDAITKGIAEESKLRQALDLQRKQGEADELAAVKALSDARSAAAKKARDEASKVPLEGSIAAFQRELDKLKSIANNIPLDAFESGVVGSIREAIRKAEADLARAQEVFADVAIDNLNERQRAALALADLEAKDAAARLRAVKATAEELAIAEKEATDKRFGILLEFEQERLQLLVDSGKATVVELTAQRNKISELERLRGVTGQEGINDVDTTRTARRTAELEEERRHQLAMLDVRTEAKRREAGEAEATEFEISQIEEDADRERLALEIEFQRKLLDIISAGGNATAEEVTAARNRLNELLAQFALPDDTSQRTRERVREVVDDILSGAEQIAAAGIEAWAAWSRAEETALDRSIDIQRERIEAAKELAERGNSAVLEEEKKRLREILKERKKAADQNAAIAKAEAVAATAVAIARTAAASAELGPFGVAIGIAAALISLAAGFVSAQQLANSAVPSYFHGGEANWSKLGGYTGDGNPKENSTAVGRKPYRYERREFIMDHETTAVGNNRKWFERILRGRVNIDHLVSPRGFVSITPPSTLDRKQVDRIVRAIEDQPHTSVVMDHRGITMMIRGRQKRDRLLGSRR